VGPSRFHIRVILFTLPVCFCIVGISEQRAAADEVALKIDHPLPYEVIQRIGFDPANAANALSGAAAFGSAEVEVSGSFPDEIGMPNELEYRVVLSDGGEGRATDWSAAFLRSHGLSAPQFRFTITVPAGGWYRLELRSANSSNGRQAIGSVEPFGVGEVFLVAGQSYATNTNDERLKVTDSTARVAAFDSAQSTWAIANDPQPAPDGSDGGSIWPPLGDSLRAALRVPVGFANVAVGGTSSEQWMPGGKLHQGLAETGTKLGRFRAVLWQQGESDVIAKTPGDTYVANLRSIQNAAVRVWKFEPVWLAAKSTLHPTVYNDPDGENRIRDAIERVSRLPGFGAGPDTDTLTGDNRGDANSRRHFSAIGQRHAAELWHQVLVETIQRTPNASQAAGFLLPDLHLLEPVWLSKIVHRESSVLHVTDDAHPAQCTLAFPPQEILHVTTADRQSQFDAGAVSFTEGQPVIQFENPDPVEPIADSELFPLSGAPNSYAHRANNPAQNLLYRPGRWFHDRNVEITYLRQLSSDEGPPVVYGALPKSIARLNSGEPLVVGISGDSISTGLDASGMTNAAPFQSGYPDLVAAQLRVLSGSGIVLHNRAVSGWSVANGLEDLDQLLASMPDLVIIAYGMNDVGRRDPQWFADQTRTLIERIQAHDQETEILLVSPMLGNREWVHTPREMFSLYRDELKALVSPGVALADVTAVWDLMLQQKHDLDLTGNGLNHPNDFGHRLYAQTVLHLLQP
jgi:acyl-CoA thioesterase-1